MKTIAFEEHFITQEFIDAMRSTVGFSTSANTDVLLDMDKGRLKVMDEAALICRYCLCFSLVFKLLMLRLV